MGIAVSVRINEAIIAYASGGIDSSPISLGTILVYFLLSTAFLVFILRMKRKDVILRFMMIISVIFGGFIALVPFIGGYSLFVTALLVFLLIKKPLIAVHNFCIMISIAGAGAIIGLSLDPFSVAVLITVLSLYDVIAIYNLGILMEPALELNAVQLFKEFSKSTSLIILWDNQSEIPDRLEWTTQKHYFFLDFSESQLKKLQYAI